MVPRHPKKEGRRCLEVFDECGWSVTENGNHFLAKCGCGKHQTTISGSPRLGEDHFKNKIQKAKKCCQPKETAEDKGKKKTSSRASND